MSLHKLCAIGTDHFDRCRENQDRLSAVEEKGVIVFAVADGMGAYDRSALGAEVAVHEAMCVILSAVSWDDLFVESSCYAVVASFYAASNALLRRADANQMLCTFISGVYCESTGTLIYGYVGDGLLAVESGGEVFSLEQPQKGATSNQTYSILSRDKWRFGVREAVDSLIVATDGIGDALLGGSDYGLADLLGEFRSGSLDSGGFEASFPSDPMLWRESPLAGVSDDRTLLIASSRFVSHDGC